MPWQLLLSFPQQRQFSLVVAGICLLIPPISFLGQHPQSFLDWRQPCSPFGPTLANPDRGFEDGANC
jgi:hypothetical protein